MDILGLPYNEQSPYWEVYSAIVDSPYSLVIKIGPHRTKLLQVWRARNANPVRPPEDFDIVVFYPTPDGNDNIECYGNLGLLEAQCVLNDVLTRWVIIEERQ